MSSHTTKGELTANVGRTLAWTQCDIFEMPAASRKRDPITSKVAGNRFEGTRKLSKLERAVLTAFAVNGPMHDITLENLPCFQYPQWPKRLAPSTVRCRRSALFSLWLLVEHGIVSKPGGGIITCWALAPWDADEAARRYRDLGKQELRREAA